MKSKLVLCSMVLGCSMGLMAQQSSAPGSAPGTTPPTFPQDQSQQQTSPDRQVGSQPDQSQTGMDHSKADKQKFEGCLGGTEGNFTLTDKSGVTYQLQGENSELSKHIGQEVRVDGMISAASANQGSSAASTPSSSDTSAASASSSSSATGAASGNTLTVHKVKKISDSCSTGSGSPSKQ